MIDRQRFHLLGFGVVASWATSLFVTSLFVTWSNATAIAAPEEANPPAVISNARQLTFEGRRAGEGYFSQDGSLLVFQSERRPGNPFFQIYLMDRSTGDIEQISPGHGKTTCAWIHPSGEKVLFASTHHDPQAREKQREELEQRASGNQRRYAWDYDPKFELYAYDRQSHHYQRLTETRGYDAEGSYSPDGQQIAFASNRHAYQEDLSEEEQKLFETDPASMNEIYIMKADGTDVRRLTDVVGYDGGPFFSPDGKRLCFRRFSPNGAVAEIWTMNTDGTDARQLTEMQVMSWAPFYHPSGDYLCFTTNRHGFANFELYLIDVAGNSTPVRVTHSDGFDGLPAFTPDGQQIAWTSNRNAARQSQLFLADWDHQLARELLGLNDGASTEDVKTRSADAAGDPTTEPATADAAEAAERVRETASPEYAADDLRQHVEYLCSDQLAGRFTGAKGERLATAYVARYFELLGLEPAGDDGGWYDEFTFTSGVALGPDNRLEAAGKTYEVDQQWRPLAFSGEGTFDKAPLVFAGYGIVLDESEDHQPYDSYAHLDVEDKWVMVLRYLPEDVSAERRQELNRASQLRFKATYARERGARGLIVVTGPNAEANSELVPLRKDGILAGSSLPVISVTNDVAEAWLQAAGKSLDALQKELDDGSLKMGFAVEGVSVTASIDVERIEKTGRNVIGRLPAVDANADDDAKQAIVVGAHIDHLGQGASSSSLARDDEASDIHYGADDNASGVAALLEIAEHLAQQREEGELSTRRDILFAAWSGEELGLLGSDHFVKSRLEETPHGSANGDSADSHAIDQPTIYPEIAACLNMDMVGRLDGQLILQGIGSSDVWRSEIERRNAVVGLPLTLQEDSYVPTDASSFYMRGVPILSAFTGAHSDYHTPRDTPDKLNYEGTAKIARFMGLVTRGLATRETPPDYIRQSVKKATTGGRLRAYLGTIPDYAEEVTGVMLSGVGKDGPADEAGVRSGDIIIELAGKKIENIYDYTHAIEGLKIGDPVKMIVRRDGKEVSLEITPASRD